MLIPFIHGQKYIHIEKADLFAGLCSLGIAIYNIIISNSPILHSPFIYIALFLLAKITLNNISINFNLLFKVLSYSLALLFVVNVLLFNVNSINFRSYNQISGFYNNINHFSLALSTASIGALYLYVCKCKRYLYTLVFLVSLIGFLQSRTYLIFVVLLLLYAVIRRLLSYKKGFITIVMVITMNILGYSLNKTLTEQKNTYGNRLVESAALIKQEKRYAVWAKALRLTQEKPLGYGLASYEFSSFFFDDNKTSLKTYKSPHNEFIRVLYELGFVGGLLIILFLVLLVFYFKTFRQNLDENKKLLIDLFIILTILDFSFQFPFERPIYFVMAIVLLSQIRTKLIFKVNSWPVKSTVVLFAGFLLLGFYSRSNTLPNNLKQSFCKYWPSEARGCLNQVKTSTPALGEALVRQSMKYNIYDFHYWQALGLMEFQNGKVAEGCSSLNMYNKVTNNLDERLIVFYKMNCQKVKINNFLIDEAISYKNL